MANDTRSLEEIRRDTERARAGLTETVGQLRATVTDTANDVREKYSPAAIKAEVNNYIKSRGEDLADGVRDSIRNNPVQAVAVGATLAYPLWKIVRSIPTPVLMIGAGLYLAGTRSGTELTQRASDAARDFAGDLERRARDFSADAADTAVAAREYASGAIDAAGKSWRPAPINSVKRRQPPRPILSTRDRTSAVACPKAATSCVAVPVRLVKRLPARPISSRRAAQDSPAWS